MASALARFTASDSRSRRLLLAFAIYVACCITFAIVAGPPRLREHTSFNHYAHLADAWLHGRQDLRNGPPAYAQGNDFAEFDGKTYISFPPFPALLMLPFVALAGSPENFRDGQFMVWMAGLAPAFLFLVLEKLRRPTASGDVRSKRSETTNVLLALLYAFGTVYFFTAVEGTVWFAAHVVGAGLLALYVLFALDAENALLAGVFMACAWMTRPSILLTAPLFALEAIRVCTPGGIPSEGTFRERVREIWIRLDRMSLLRHYALFALPIVIAIGIASWMNYSRYHRFDPTAFGHEYLGVVWKGRMQKWGLFGYHYLAKNLGCMLTILPWLPPKGVDSIGGAAFKINEHGLAIWFTMPFYFWLLKPKTKGWLYVLIALSALVPAAMDLLYQNSGWRQFGYRFSNDYSILLFVLLAIGDLGFGWRFRAAAAWGVAWNLFGAVTFDRAEFDKYYFREGSQTVLYQPD